MNKTEEIRWQPKNVVIQMLNTAQCIPDMSRTNRKSKTGDKKFEKMKRGRNI